MLLSLSSGVGSCLGVEQVSLLHKEAAYDGSKYNEDSQDSEHSYYHIGAQLSIF